ncbi:MAG: hypothetical protein CMJ64_16390 [Planctomycetaceae bacterium]|jgi:hypothetical protein|nr:hypothetical protein [Planctomycetaceae bacterium]
MSFKGLESSANLEGYPLYQAGYDNTTSPGMAQRYSFIVRLSRATGSIPSSAWPVANTSGSPFEILFAGDGSQR